MKSANEAWLKSQNVNLTPEQRKIYTDQYEALIKQAEDLGTKAKENALLLMKDNKYVAPTDYYSKFRKPLFAKGGTIAKEMNRVNLKNYTERLKDVRDEAKSSIKSNNEALKGIQKLIDKALKTK